MKVASSGTKEGLLKLINEFYFTNNCVINEDDTVTDTKLNKVVGEVKQEKRKFIYYAK